MRNIVAFIAGFGLLFVAFVGLALAIVIGVVATGAIAVARLTGRQQPAAARPVSGSQDDRAQPQYRVWNDGRGTIIDM